MKIWQQYEFQMLPSCRRPAQCTPGPDHRPVRGKQRRGKLHLHTCIVAEWNYGMVDGDKAEANWDIIPVTFDRFRIRSLLFSVQEAVWANCRPPRPTKLVGEWRGGVLGMFLTFCWLASGVWLRIPSHYTILGHEVPAGQLPGSNGAAVSLWEKSFSFPSCLGVDSRYHVWLLPNSNVLSISSLFKFLWLDYPQSVLFP